MAEAVGGSRRLNAPVQFSEREDEAEGPHPGPSGEPGAQPEEAQSR
jgi:hypothetical protein